MRRTNGWQCGRRVVSQLQKDGQRAPDFLFTAAQRARFTGLFLKDLADSRQGSNKNRPSYLISNPAVTIGEMTVCYILDGILILYGIILTVLYCRLRMSSSDKEPPNPAEKKPAEGGIYAGLTSHSTDTYETIKMDKKPVV
ncbi:Fc receptor, IgE, high affinity I, gamma polypeptide like [Epinephelus fuscoguttatus]|uniref:Fc receptor, IgE, high affinity I, gamma polypeptide like n=1 Tax=Epinephelus fuscoguttatus TaxID=293821 RepID=UPI0020D0B0A6|nr:Fc receptor, IgE, high affinity I, gamma polypeptide like [Epinephelus fuscoguttatus]